MLTKADSRESSAFGNRAIGSKDEMLKNISFFYLLLVRLVV